MAERLLDYRRRILLGVDSIIWLAQMLLDPQSRLLNNRQQIGGLPQLSNNFVSMISTISNQNLLHRA